MKRTNRGQTTLKIKNRPSSPMSEFDGLPPELRRWLANAILPWSARSVKKAYRKAKSDLGNTASALNKLNQIEAKLIAKDRPIIE